jgi:hypothetical protein
MSVDRNKLTIIQFTMDVVKNMRCPKCNSMVWPPEKRPSCVGESFIVCSECRPTTYLDVNGREIEVPNAWDNYEAR